MSLSIYFRKFQANIICIMYYKIKVLYMKHTNIHWAFD